MVLRPKEIDKEADPARQEDDDRADDLAYYRNWFLEDVDDRQDGEDKTDDVEDFCQGVIEFPTI